MIYPEVPYGSSFFDSICETQKVEMNTPSAAPPSSTLQSIKTQSRAKDEEEKIKQKRKRGVIVMMLQFLSENGLGRSLDALQQETGVTLAKHAPADNMDLTTIFSQFEDYYDIRYGRKPKFFRICDGETTGNGMETVMEGGEKMFVRKRSNSNERTGGRPPQAVTPTSASSGGAMNRTSSQRNPANNPIGGVVANSVHKPPQSAPSASDSSGGTKPKFGLTLANAAGRRDGTGDSPPGPALEAGGTTMNIRKGIERIRPEDSPDAEEPLPFEGRLNLKPLPRFESSELNELAQLIFRDILDHDPCVGWKDIAELGAVKQLLKEAVVMPLKYPQLFSGIVRPWHGILLFGPPGTGKTLMAKAVATECRTTFFNVSASTIVSKYRGDSEKLVRMLFDLAVHFAPSTIFIDELDSIMSQRGSSTTEHEGSRRMKTELLIQMDGLSKRKNGELVFVLAASNVPWDLDTAMLRRLEKRICVGLPTHAARKAMFRKNLASTTSNFDFDLVAARTDGYSGADVDIICREATMRTIRVMIAKLESDRNLGNEAVQRPQVSTDDVIESIKVTKPTNSNIDPQKYAKWEKEFGSTISAGLDPTLDH